MIKKIIMAIPLLFLTHGACHAGGKTLQDMMIQDLESVSYTMEILYAPKEWKQEQFDWSLHEETERARAKIYDTNAQTPKEYQKIFLQFLNSTRDYHVGAGFYSTALSIFPLSIKEVGSRFYITQIDPDLENVADFLSLFNTFEPIQNLDLYQKNALKLKVGDEVVAMNGVPLLERIQNSLIEDFGGDLSPTARALAANALFFRDSMSGHDAPREFFDITVRHQGADEPVTYTFPWFHLQEEIMDKSSEKTTGETAGSTIEGLITKYGKKDFSIERVERIMKNQAKKRLQKRFAPGEKVASDQREKGFLPPLGKILWETDKNGSLYGYIYQTASGKKIGYLYLDSFLHIADADKQISAIANALTRLNRESEALVLDITDNPGGEAGYMYAVLSMLTEKPLSSVSMREILVQKDVFSALQFKQAVQQDVLKNGAVGTLWGYTYNKEVMQGIIRYCDQIVENWNAGKTFTDPVYIYGIEKIQPHPRVRYKNPILVLVNELNFSCADIFPAILQDNNRATLFGKKTAGAGGGIAEYRHNSRFGVMYYTLTNSILTRPNGQLIENIGVTPDISCELTENDIKQNYADYIQAVNAAVSGILQ